MVNTPKKNQMTTTQAGVREEDEKDSESEEEEDNVLSVP